MKINALRDVVKHILGITEYKRTVIINQFRFFGTKCITYKLFYPKLYNYASKRIICTSFMWIWEQTAIISLYSINWLVFITETECLLRGTDWVFIYNSTFCPHSVFMCFVWIWEQTAFISLYSINWLVCITETECVYCAVRTGSLYIILRSAHTVYLCVLCGSENKQRLFPYTALTDWFA